MKTTQFLVLIIFLSYNTVFTQQNDTAPEATTEETKSSFRDIPYLKKAFIDHNTNG